MQSHGSTAKYNRKIQSDPTGSGLVQRQTTPLIQQLPVASQLVRIESVVSVPVGLFEIGRMRKKKSLICFVFRASICFILVFPALGARRSFKLETLISSIGSLRNSPHIRPDPDCVPGTALRTLCQS